MVLSFGSSSLGQRYSMKAFLNNWTDRMCQQKHQQKHGLSFLKGRNYWVYN